MWHAQILSLINHRKFIMHLAPVLAEVLGNGGENTRGSGAPLLSNGGAHLFQNRPQNLALCFCKPGFAA